jgi:hypothetical protein
MRINRTAVALTARAMAATALVGSALLAGTAAAKPATLATACTPTWKIVPTPTPPSTVGTQFEMSGVDVVSRTDVRFPAVAYGLDVYAPWTLKWDGSTLSALPPIPHSPLTTQSAEAGSFDSGTDGWELGHGGAGGFQLAARWSGGGWTLVPLGVPADPASEAAWLHDIAALSPTDAWAVGATYHAGPGTVLGVDSRGVLIQHWDGTRWTTVDNPLAHQPDSTLNAVRALSATDIWATGWRGDGNGTFATLVEHWDGHSWTVLPTPPGMNRAGMHAISASGPNDVWITGDQGTPENPGEARALIEHWDGHAWTVADLPDLGNTAVLGVYAAGPTDVWATTEVTGQGVASSFLHWDGHTWTVNPAPGLRAYGMSSYYFGMGGTGHDDVWAAGWSYDFGSGNGTPQIAHLTCGRS